jgi:NifU-like protein involved in Fe-S cluster formation
MILHQTFYETARKVLQNNVVQGELHECLTMTWKQLEKYFKNVVRGELHACLTMTWKQLEKYFKTM